MKVKLTADHYLDGHYVKASHSSPAIVDLPDETKLGEGMVAVEEPAPEVVEVDLEG